MKLDLQLTSFNGRPPLAFTWDSDTGHVNGSGASLVLQRVQMAIQHGTRLRGIAEVVVVADPLHNPAEMALVLGRDYALPPELEALYPVIEDTGDGPEGTVY
jgi:hypothetical protein